MSTGFGGEDTKSIGGKTKEIEMSKPNDGPEAFHKEVEKRMKRLGMVSEKVVAQETYKGLKLVVKEQKWSDGSGGCKVWVNGDKHHDIGTKTKEQSLSDVKKHIDDWVKKGGSLEDFK